MPTNPYALTPYNERPSALAEARSQIANYRASGVASTVGQVKTSAEILGGAAAGAYISGRMGGPDGYRVLGMPVELALGAGLALVSGQAGGHRADVLAVALGCASSYAARKGFEAGLQANLKAAQSGQKQTTSGVGASPYASAEAALDDLASRRG